MNSVSLILQGVKKIVLGVPRKFPHAKEIDKPFVWQSVTFHMEDGKFVTVDCCQFGVVALPVECRKSYELLDALNHHTAVLLREMDPNHKPETVDAHAVSEGPQVS